MCAEFEFRHAGRCAIGQGKAFGVSLANQGTAGLDLVRSQGDIGGVLEHDLLPLAAQNEAKKLIERRIERLAGRLVGVEEREAAQRIGGECNVLVSRRLRKPTFSKAMSSRHSPRWSPTLRIRWRTNSSKPFRGLMP